MSNALLRWLNDVLCNAWYQTDEFERRLGLPQVASEKLFRAHLHAERRLLEAYFPGERFYVGKDGCYQLTE